MAVGDGSVTIRKVKKVMGHGHHGGAWKVAYADFVTAMMAFFLLMWLINTTSPEQKRGIADYFAPASVSQSTSGSGGILGGTAPDSQPAGQTGRGDGKPQDAKTAQQAAMEKALERREDQAFQSAAQSLRQALQDMPELAELSKQVLIDQTPEGLRIQLVDQDGRSMYKEGSAAPNDRAKILLRAITKIVNQLPNRITISGHTSANADGSKTENDWQLSAARANAARPIMQAAGVDADRVYQVSGKANSDPLYPDDPTLPGNRRIAIVLLREAPVLPPDHSL